MRPSVVLASAILLALTACAVPSPPTASPPAGGEIIDWDTEARDIFQIAIEDPRRPAAEVERDELRKPHWMMSFAGTGRGRIIADIRPEEGYFTRLFAVSVGPQGRIYAFVPTRTAQRENAFADGLAAEYGNVVRVTGALDSMSFPEPLDLVFMAQEYHDFHIPGFQTDVAAMNRAVFAALKPGGYYVITDHDAAPGAGISAVQTLHRIEGPHLIREVEAAGFVLDGDIDFLRNPADDRSLNVFDEAIRGRTDQFVYRFKKPE